MWNQKNQMRNRFLHTELPNCSAQVVNEYISAEFQNISDGSDAVLGLKSIQPVKLRMLCDRGNLAYGFCGLPILLKDMACDDPKTQLCAMNTLAEVLLNDLECARAILEFDIVRRLQNFLIRRRLQKMKDQRLIPVILRCFEIIACSLLGAVQMSRRSILIHELYTLAEKGEHKKVSSCILRTLTQQPQIIDYFIHQTNWFHELSEILDEHFIALMDLNLLEHFSHFLQLRPQMAIDFGWFDQIFREIQERQASQKVLLKCFAFLLNCKEGQDKLDKCDGVAVLYRIFMDPYMETHEFAAQALQSATAASRTSLWRCKEFWDLPQELIKRAHIKTNERQQMYCLQILRQITMMPSVKQFVRKTCIPQIRNIGYRDEKIRQEKNNLLRWLKSDVYNQ